MRINEKNINELLKDRKAVQISFRYLSKDDYSEFRKYDQSKVNFAINSKLIDGLKFKLKYVTVCLNCRHKFF